MMRIFKNQRGDTILEVLLAVTVLSLVLAATFATANRSTQATRTASERSEAYKFAQAEMEKIKLYLSTPGIDQPPEDSYFCMNDDGDNYVQLNGTAPTDPLADPNFTDGIYQDAIAKNACQNGPGDLYFQIAYRGGSTESNTYMAFTRWTSVDGNNVNEASIVHRVYPNLAASISGGTGSPTIPTTTPPTPANEGIKVSTNVDRSAAINLDGANLNQYDEVYIFLDEYKNSASYDVEFVIVSSSGTTTQPREGSEPWDFNGSMGGPSGPPNPYTLNDAGSFTVRATVYEEGTNNQVDQFSSDFNVNAPAFSPIVINSWRPNPCTVYRQLNDQYAGCFQGSHRNPNTNRIENATFAYRNFWAYWTFPTMPASAVGTPVDIIIYYQQAPNLNRLAPSGYSYRIGFGYGSFESSHDLPSRRDYTELSYKISTETAQPASQSMYIRWENNVGFDPNLQINRIEIRPR